MRQRGLVFPCEAVTYSPYVMDMLKMIEWARRVVRPALLSLALLTGVHGSEVRAQTAGSSDSTFQGVVFGGSGVARATAIQPDGKIVVAGNFTTIGNSYPSISRNNIARLNSGGTPDTSFDPGTGTNNTVDCLAVQPDGKILAGGLFTAAHAQGASYLCRWNTDGTLDPGFATGLVTGEVLGIAVQPDGKIIAVGSFSTVNGTSQSRITRLNSDGTLDPTFSQQTSANGQINTVALQPDGNIVIGGLFTTVNGSTANRIARLTSAGLFDSSFNPGSGANGGVNCVALQPDGKILLSGAFSLINATTRGGLARLNPDGTLEGTTTFNPGSGPSGPINSIALQTDGKIICGGNFFGLQRFVPL